MSNPPAKPTLAHIAEACRVSPMTVSRALRRDGSVSEETRDKVLRVAEEMGYQPRPNMGRPRTRPEQRPAVDLVFGAELGGVSLFYADLLGSIEQELQRHGYDCVVRACHAAYAPFVALLEGLRESPAEKTLILGYFPLERLRIILEQRPGAVLVDHTGDPQLHGAYESVGFDNVEAARLAVRHLAGQGRTRIALLKGPPEHYFSRDIEQGYRETLGVLRLEVDPTLIWTADFTSAGAQAATWAAIERGVSFDAVFTNDEMAFGVIRELRQRGMQLPADVAVAGCDGLELGQYLSPSLTTVILDRRELGRAAVERLFAPREEGGPHHIRLLPRLEVRESTAKE